MALVNFVFIIYTHKQRAMTLAPQSGEGWNRPNTAEWRGMAPEPQTGEGWCRPSTAERRGMETSRYRGAERDGIAPTPQSGEGWHRRVERDGPSSSDRRGMVSP